MKKVDYPFLLGSDLFGNPVDDFRGSILNSKYLFPPTTVLDTRKGRWQNRKQAWRRLGIKGELGRLDEVYLNIGKYIKKYKSRRTIQKRSTATSAIIEDVGTSIFDPVLCEVLYQWYSPSGGLILDPFAGGSVRGIVACMMGRRYWGCELRLDQVNSNRDQASSIIPTSLDKDLIWKVGDSSVELDKAPRGDFLFSCPPYGSLEKYSDDPRDLSNMDYDGFLEVYEKIIMKSTKKLRNHSFASFVVGDFRDRFGYYHNFVSDTIGLFLKYGLRLYNRAILLNVMGSVQIRVSGQFSKNRKLGRVHQDVLIFVKGDWKKAVRKLGDI